MDQVVDLSGRGGGTIYTGYGVGNIHYCIGPKADIHLHYYNPPWGNDSSKLFERQNGGDIFHYDTKCKVTIHYHNAPRSNTRKNQMKRRQKQSRKDVEAVYKAVLAAKAAEAEAGKGKLAVAAATQAL